jgi:predicted kinase
MCKREAANVLDHVVPHRGNAELFWAQSNWQALCVGCHGIKTARESWQIDSAPRSNAVVLVTIGAPGAGKSTWCASQRARVVTTDALRSITDNRAAIADVFSTAFDDIRSALRRGQSVILDSCAANPRIRQQVIEAARMCRARAIAVVFDTDVDTCCSRQREREHAVPLDVVRSIHETLQGITDMRLRSEGFDEVLRVSRACPS